MQSNQAIHWEWDSTIGANDLQELHHTLQNYADVSPSPIAILLIVTPAVTEIKTIASCSIS